MIVHVYNPERILNGHSNGNSNSKSSSVVKDSNKSSGKSSTSTAAKLVATGHHEEQSIGRQPPPSPKLLRQSGLFKGFNARGTGKFIASFALPIS